MAQERIKDSEPRSPSALDLSHKPHRWHPKISPYRLIVVTTTASLGTAKAIEAYRGVETVSITLEWVSGVLVSLLFFIADWFEDSKAFPTSLLWFFKSDCMDVVWCLFTMCSISRPVYSSTERTVKLHAWQRTPPVTGYRMLVTASITMFGTVKAALSYLGRPTAATAVDWTLAVVMTLTLYIIGFYEENSIDLLPSLFFTDYSHVFDKPIRVVKHTLLYGTGIVACLYWLDFWGRWSIHFLREPLELGAPDTKGDRGLKPTFLDPIHDVSLKAMVLSVTSIYIVIGGVILLTFFWLWARSIIPDGFSGRRILQPLRTLVLVRISSWLKGKQKAFFQARLASLSLSLRLLMHAAIHLFAAASCIVISVVWFGFAVRLCPLFVLRDGFGAIGFGLFFGVFSGSAGLLSLYPLIPISRSLAHPFYVLGDPKELRRHLWAF